jgi:hypothetical protein
MKLIKLLGILLLVPVSVRAQQYTEQIDSVFNTYFNLLELYVNDPNTDTAFKRIQIIRFMENISNIDSESDGTYFGKLYPTAHDVKNWRDWYETHKSELYWDARDKRVNKEKEK